MSQWSEHSIARAIALQTLARKCVVLVDNCGWTGHECDVLGVTTDLRIIDVEVKISRADLKADAKKDKWWHRQYGAWIPGQRRQEVTTTARQHPPKVWKHYYAMPADIWKPDLLDCLPSKASGVLLLSYGKDYTDLHHRPHVIVECIRRATPNKDATRLTPSQAIDIARLANLRMWEAYHRRDEAQKHGVAA
ncbi:hypothetical protein METUNv1_01703 [Methyloversatilis universalis FAM5]|uniref:Uncharacterized protein n=1 Tax=Methyloversatilis universalis (strain ATCC BAA-1314 / DSM 25237 / JCM 13912 / CCUG 52030 / FAM5) TaxID=1000565 RepID=F5RBQ8_METUF|nr:hypothetical protein [Methyloversatilis universalis]EGK71925.1 hypothetical protein METUNv1_01703 [Methyloversatilis universalis FAM5]